MREALDTDTVRSVYDRAAGRYDLYHSLATARSDERGRRLLVDRAVKPEDRVLDCGAGTGSTALLAARKAGLRGSVTLVDMSHGMLAVARQRAEASGLSNRMTFQHGDILSLPFEDASFDVVLSTYSLCPVFDPSAGALELYRVTRKGGLLAVAHSSEPTGRMLSRIAEGFESLVWKFPSLSLGCRSVSVLPALESVGARVIFSKKIGVPLWPFVVFIVEKPET